VLTPRKAVEIALHGGHSKRVPFTMYECKIPQCVAEREMRNRGLCIVERRIPVVKTHQPNCKISQHIYWENGKQFTRTIYETPKGNLSTLNEAAGFTSWQHEKMFKSPVDYPAILALIQDQQFEPSYEAFACAQEDLGEDFILRAAFGLEPLQEFITGYTMKMEDFCIEWMENRDEILKLYQATVENRRKIYPLVAQSPALHANYGGNITPEITGAEIFEKYYIQHYNEAAEIMHKHGKFIGCHFDGNCKTLSSVIAKTNLDYIEAFTPAPDTDMTLAQAREAWPDKVLWINYPSSVHLKSDEEVEAVTMNLLDQAKKNDGLIIGITEDIPSYRWKNSCRAIMNGLDTRAR
jgi:hypothetical protein